MAASKSAQAPLYETSVAKEERSPPTLPAEGAPGEPTNRPKLVVDDSVHEFGVMALREVRSHSFHFRNDGDAPLEITGTSSNCKCVSHELSHTELRPGEHGTLKLKWRGGDVEKDRLTARVRMETNDPQQEVVEFSAIGRVGDQIRLSPTELHTRGVAPGQTVEASTVVGSIAWSVFELEQITAPAEQVTVTSEQLSESEAGKTGLRCGWRVTIRAEPPLTLESFDGHLELIASGRVSSESQPEKRTLRVPVGWELKQALSLSGPGVDGEGKIHLGRVGREPLRKRFLLKVSDEEPELFIRNQQVSPEYLTVKLEPYRKTSSGRLYRLEVSAPVNAAPTLDGALSFEFDHPRIKRFEAGIEIGESI